MPTYDANYIPFRDAPANFDYTGTLYNTLIADLDDNGAQAILAFDLTSQHSSIAFRSDWNANWADSSSAQDWPVLDKAFGRDTWKTLVAEHEIEALEEIAEDDE